MIPSWRCCRCYQRKWEMGQQEAEGDWGRGCECEISGEKQGVGVINPKGRYSAKFKRLWWDRGPNVHLGHSKGFHMDTQVGTDFHRGCVVGWIMAVLLSGEWTKWLGSWLIRAWVEECSRGLSGRLFSTQRTPLICPCLRSPHTDMRNFWRSLREIWEKKKGNNRKLGVRKFMRNF